MRLAKRRDRVTVVSAVVAVIVVGALVRLDAPARLFDRGFVPAGTEGHSIPSRITAPPMFQPSVKSQAAGSASVLFGGIGWQHPLDLDHDHDGDLALVGSTSDVRGPAYRPSTWPTTRSRAAWCVRGTRRS